MELEQEEKLERLVKDLHDWLEDYYRMNPLDPRFTKTLVGEYDATYRISKELRKILYGNEEDTLDDCPDPDAVEESREKWAEEAHTDCGTNEFFEANGITFEEARERRNRQGRMIRAE